MNTEDEYDLFPGAMLLGWIADLSDTDRTALWPMLILASQHDTGWDATEVLPAVARAIGMATTGQAPRPASDLTVVIDPADWWTFLWHGGRDIADIPGSGLGDPGVAEWCDLALRTGYVTLCMGFDVLPATAHPADFIRICAETGRAAISTVPVITLENLTPTTAVSVTPSTMTARPIRL